MEFQINKVLTKLGANVIITFDEPFENILRIIQYKDYVDGLSNISKISREFAVSYDSKEWSLRHQLTDSNLVVNIDISQKFYLKLFYKVVEKYDESPIIINSFELTYEEKSITEEVIEAPTEGLNMLDEIEYNVDLTEINEYAEKTEQATNYFLNKTSPIEVLYFRHEPDMDTQDVFLNEWSIHNEKDRKCIKVIIDENTIPKGNVQFEEWGVDFERFTVKIDKVYFEEIFGKDIRPRNNDYAFFQKANRMYYIFSNELVTGANEGAPVYELSLKKYDDDTSIKKSESTEDFLEEKTITREKLFGDKMKEEMIDMVNNDQNVTKFISDDGIREEISESMTIVEERIYNNKIELMKSYYDLTMIPDNEVSVKYKKEHELPIGGGWSAMAWVKKFEIETDIKFDIVSQRRIDTYHIQLELSETNDLLKINDDNYIKRGDDIFYVDEVIDNYNIKILSRTFVDEAKLDDFEKIVPVNITTSIGIDATFRVDLLDSGIFIRHNNSLLRFTDIPSINDKWTGVVVNISNNHNHVGAYLWQMDDNPEDTRSTALLNIYKKEFVINDPIVINKVTPFVTGSNSNYGNLRIFNRTIDFEYQSYIMSHRVLKKPSMAFVVDDCQVIFNYPKITKGNTVTSVKEV